MEPLGTQHILLGKRQLWPMSQPTSSVRPPMPSRPHVLPHRKERVRAQGDLSAAGNATSFRRRFVSLYSTTSG